MNSETSHPNSIPLLLRELRDDTATLLRQEVALAKTELKENASRMTGQAVHVAVGGLVAYAGMIVLLIGSGHLLGAVFVKSGMEPQVAQWLAPAAVGLVVAMVGWVMVSKARHAIAHDELTPHQTLASVRDHKQWAQRKLHHPS